MKFKTNEYCKIKVFKTNYLTSIFNHLMVFFRTTEERNQFGDYF